ncbi:MAG TPA: alkaline phosphatase [Bacteroidales bacterium]|nr:alkaline phosphatase [Bacteroidales bacterium]
MMSVKRFSVLLTALLFLTFTSCSDYSEISTSQPPEKEIKNVILMIGDGMGLPDVYAAMTVATSPLNIQRTKVTGLQINYSANNYITDSGASGTALATGTKTNNYSIGVDAQGNKVKSILEIAEENKLSTGLVSTSAITHATPASFIAHQSSRSSYEDIALDFLKTDVDVIIGGGYNHFAVRKDNLNLLDSLRKRGYDVVNSVDAMTRSTASKLAAFTAPDHNPYRLKGRGDMLPLATAKAIEILSRNNKGFFLMVEGSQIDFAGHANAADTLIDEVIDFDKAVGVAIDYAERVGNTLVVVTADHETGGVTIVGGNRNDHTVDLDFSRKDHTAVMIPVYVFGPGAYSFTGIYDNTDIFRKIKAALGI